MCGLLTLAGLHACSNAVGAGMTHDGGVLSCCVPLRACLFSPLCWLGLWPQVVFSGWHTQLAAVFSSLPGCRRADESNAWGRTWLVPADKVGALQQALDANLVSRGMQQQQQEQQRTLQELAEHEQAHAWQRRPLRIYICTAAKPAALCHHLHGAHHLPACLTPMHVPPCPCSRPMCGWASWSRCLTSCATCWQQQTSGPTTAACTRHSQRSSWSQVCACGVCVGGVRDGTAACSQLAGWLAGAGGIHKWPWPLLGRHVNTARQQQSPQRACGKTSGLRACPRHSLSAACRVCVPLAAGVSLADRMRPFQREGVQFGLRAGGRVLIGDEMGLGKTVQACALAKCYQAEWPVLVVTPSSLR